MGIKGIRWGAVGVWGAMRCHGTPSHPTPSRATLPHSTLCCGIPNLPDNPQGLNLGGLMQGWMISVGPLNLGTPMTG